MADMKSDESPKNVGTKINKQISTDVQDADYETTSAEYEGSTWMQHLITINVNRKIYPTSIQQKMFRIQVTQIGH